MDKEKVYIVINKKASIQPDKDILVENLGEVYCDKPDIKKAIENMRVKKRNIEEDWDYITATDISGKVLGKYPDIDLDLLGEVEVLIEYKSREKERPFLEFVKVLLVCIVLFFGASIAIINFHADVDAKQSMEKLYFTFTGEKKDNPLIMNIPYSIGIGVGVLTFFTRIFSFSNRRKKEPGPMEIELFLYDEEMEQFILNETKKKD